VVAVSFFFIVFEGFCSGFVRTLFGNATMKRDFTADLPNNYRRNTEGNYNQFESFFISDT
jgi:hypothetical protein